LGLCVGVGEASEDRERVGGENDGTPLLKLN
jgi:hypothetical protein